MSCNSYEDLKRHIGHKLVIACYGTEEERIEGNPENIAIECETCNEVLLDFDREIKKKLKCKYCKSTLVKNADSGKYYCPNEMCFWDNEEDKRWDKC